MQVVIIDNNNDTGLLKTFAEGSGCSVLEYNSYDDFFTKFSFDVDSIVIIDMDNKNLFWRECLGIISQQFTGLKIILNASSSTFDNMKYSYLNNVVGFIPKNMSPKLQEIALNFVIEGGTFYPPLFDEMTNRRKSILNENDNILTKQSFILTNRQEEVLCNLCKGLSNKQIAHEMNLAEATVKLHVNALLRSLGVTNRTHAVITAQKMGIIPYNL